MADIASAVVGFFGVSTKINEFVVTPLRNQFRYLFLYYELIQHLRVGVGRLNKERASLQGRIDCAGRNLEVIRPSVEDWIRRADEMITEANRILDAAPEVQNGTCLSGTCPNLKSCYSLGKKVNKIIENVKQLQEECGMVESVSDPAPPTGNDTIPPTTSGTLEFESRKRKEEEIMECLRDDKILMVGICGMGGAGKTTMVDKIVKTASEEKLFDEIVKVIVSQQVDFLKIQKQIARPLGLKLENEEIVSVLANRLHKRLLTAKKVLLYFDDVWGRLDLEELGIPPRCKIILTSRDQDVCKQMMCMEDARKILMLDGLREDESWALFREKTGSVVDKPHLHQYAVDVAKECKGLPLALATVGSAMREKTNKAAWEDALLQLRRAVLTNIQSVIRYVYQPLKLSYDALESDEDRYFFLLCCLFPEDADFCIEGLVYYGVGLRIFSATTNIREARNRAHNLVEMLKNCSLLMDADDSEYRHTCVKMHDVIRDMALSIASRGKHVFMVSHDRSLKAWPENDSHCEDFTCIALTLGKETFIPKSINYQRLEALYLHKVGGFEQRNLPKSFFDGVTCLRLLGIHDAVSSLSLDRLTHLRVLQLFYYKSGTIPFAGDLVNLEILSFYESYIEVLPKEIGELTKLKLLNLNNSKRLKNIAPGVLSSLIQLEELRLRRCPIEWEVEEKGSERSNASLVEVFSLKNLSLLEIWIQGLELIPKDTSHLNKLTSYSIKIGKRSPKFVSEQIHNEKCMIVQVDERNASAHVMYALFAGAERLYVSGSGTQDIIDLLARQEFKNLMELEVENLDTTKHLTTTTELLNITSRSTGGIFSVLRKLWISKMEQLEEIFHGPPIVGSFSELQDLHLEKLGSLVHLWKDPSGEICMSNLKRIKILNCTNVKWVFPLSSVAQSLSQLEEIEIVNCPNLEEVFKDERVIEGGVTTFHPVSFQKLKRMILKSLPKLSTLCKAFGVFEFPSIEILEIKQSSNIKFFTRLQPDFSNKEIGTEKFYSDVLPTGILKWLHTLEISSFHGFKTLFSYDAFRGLENLEVLNVSDCSMLEEIIELEQNKEQHGSVMIDKTIISRLRGLKLSKLPKICYFCTFNNSLELPSLEELIIEYCPMMETFGFGKEVISPNLHTLVLEGLNFTAPIFCHEISTESINALRRLEIKGCHCLKNLFSPKIFKELTNLEDLRIEDCHILEEAIVVEEETAQVGVIQEAKVVWKLPKLHDLVLCQLPKMIRFSYIQSDLEFPSLETIGIWGCPELKSSLSLDLRCLSNYAKVYGISDPKFASRLLFDKEFDFSQLTEDEGRLNHGCFKLLQSDLSFTQPWGKAYLLKGLSNEFFFDNWEDIHGEIEIEKLSSGIMYEIVFVIMLVKEIYPHYYGDLKLKISVASDQREEYMTDKPIEEWIEILGGEFIPSSGQHEQLQFSVAKNYAHLDGVLLKGVYI